jgi:predicted Rossmann fold nucleotide-binding protein DprA/Smf involved in DNA uptake
MTHDIGETTEKPRRGRPRPQETIDRDERILNLVREGPVTRNLIISKTGISPTLVYLSLSRLRREGLVTMCPGFGVQKRWTTETDCS